MEEALHLGICEFYIKKNAKLTFTMIHNWSETIGVRPRTVIMMDEGATYINNYVALKPVKSIQTYPTCKMDGKNGVCVVQHRGRRPSGQRAGPRLQGH